MTPTPIIVTYIHQAADSMTLFLYFQYQDGIVSSTFYLVCKKYQLSWRLMSGERLKILEINCTKWRKAEQSSREGVYRLGVKSASHTVKIVFYCLKPRLCAINRFGVGCVAEKTVAPSDILRGASRWLASFAKIWIFAHWHLKFISGRFVMMVMMVMVMMIMIAKQNPAK